MSTENLHQHVSDHALYDSRKTSDRSLLVLKAPHAVNYFISRLTAIESSRYLSMLFLSFVASA